jgi:hypothetical protein
MRKLKWVVIALVVLFGFTYATYSYSYAGNYNVEVSIPVHGVTVNQGAVWVVYGTPSPITTDSEPTTIWQFWSSLSVASGEDRLYTYEVYCELTTAGGPQTQHQSFDITPSQNTPGAGAGVDRTFTFEFKNVEPGEQNVHVYVMDRTMSTKIFDTVYPAVIG